MYEFIEAVQQKNPYILQRKTLDKRKDSAGFWNLDKPKLLKYKDLLYIFEKTLFREKLLKRYHNDILIGFFGIKNYRIDKPQILLKKYA